jgi:phage pi2 protein 07
MDNNFESKSNWKRLNLTNKRELKSRIRDIFEKSDHQEQILIGLYRMVFPDWDRIIKIDGYPEAGGDLWKFICRQFQEFDRVHHPGCMPGGAWMNTGFSVNNDLEGWEISFDNCHVEYIKTIKSNRR